MRLAKNQTIDGYTLVRDPTCHDHHDAVEHGRRDGAVQGAAGRTVGAEVEDADLVCCYHHWDHGKILVLSKKTNFQYFHFRVRKLPLTAAALPSHELDPGDDGGLEPVSAQRTPSTGSARGAVQNLITSSAKDYTTATRSKLSNDTDLDGAKLAVFGNACRQRAMSRDARVQGRSEMGSRGLFQGPCRRAT